MKKSKTSRLVWKNMWFNLAFGVIVTSPLMSLVLFLNWENKNLGSIEGEYVMFWIFFHLTVFNVCFGWMHFTERMIKFLYWKKTGKKLKPKNVFI